ncbi:cytochrome P450 [Tamaricihabitans halophyticus]|uniref:Cytochrome P450 n=1 Tax=Tamaricihabitans halophyticus TaxID=1262583 RepID=A0A4R2QXW0_9PSEU|nr:cytochrome P450 [Tamaricihabitans halophyticus]TCP55042.1 cytochrome P450 [Tamaricihabitans halophyticus]
MKTIRKRLGAWVGRRYLARAQKKGLDLSQMSFLPDSALLPLKRDGLDPIPELGQRRAEEPVSKLPLPFGLNVWLVTGYAEAKTVLSKADAFSNDFSHLLGAGFSEEQNPGGLGFSDPPTHTRLRKLLTPEFTMRRLKRLAPRIESIVEGQLDEIARADGPVDLVESFALPIPSLTICELLGVPYADRAEFQRLSTARFDLFGGAGASLGAISESLSYLSEIVKKQRAEPGDDLLGMLIKEHGDEIDDTELAGLADGLLTGGLETTASMLALGTIILLRDRECFQLVHDDDAAIGPFVEELLRYLTVVQVAFPRFATEDIEIGDKRIESGDVVLVSLSSVNRDDTLGTEMEQFAGTRKPSAHMAFGYGIHRCVGAELGRMELRAAYPALVRRFPRMRLAVDPAELTFRTASAVYGVERLPVLPH